MPDTNLGHGTMRKALYAFGLAVGALMACSNAFGQEENELIPIEKYGYQDASGKIVIPLQFDEAYWFYEGLARVMKYDDFGAKYGFIDKKGTTVVDLKYDDASDFSSGLAAVLDGEKWGYIDKTGKMVIQPQFDEARDFSGNIATVRIGDWFDGKWGCIDKSGKMVIQPKYDEPLIFQNGLVAMATVGEKQVIINNKEKTIAEFPRDASVYINTYGDFQHGWGRVSVDDKIGLLDENGWVLAPQFDDAAVLGDIAAVAITINEEEDISKVGVVDKNGKWILECKEGAEIYLIDEDNCLLLAVIDEKYGFLNEKGWATEPKYDDVGRFSEDMISVREGDVWGFVDKTGKICIKPQFESLYLDGPLFNEGLAVVASEGKVGFIDKKGKWTIQPQYDGALPFSEELAAVLVGEKWGYIDKTGKMVIQPSYDDVYYFSLGLAPVKVNGKWGFIDKTNKMVIQPQYDDTGMFDPDTGKAWVLIGDWDTGTSGYIDKNGKFEPIE